jgi:hypothetical protein
MADTRIANGDKLMIVDHENALTYPVGRRITHHESRITHHESFRTAIAPIHHVTKNL